MVVPLIAAPTCVLLHRARLAWGLTAVVSWVAFAVALALLHQVNLYGPISYPLGGWAAPWGIEYRVDHANVLLLLVVSGASAVVVPFARASIEREVAPNRIYLVYTIWLLCLTGLLGMAITGDAFNVFVFLEISSLASYALISMGPDRRALTAAFRYLVMGTVGGTFFLIGVGFLYMMTGTLNMADLHARIPAVAHTGTVQVALAFIVVGMGLKLALFPLHFWLPDAYRYAPSAVTAFLAASATKVAVYVMARFLYGIFGGQIAFGMVHLEQILVPLAALGVLAASVVAVFQDDVKRMLAYSSVAQIGYMVLGIGIATTAGITAGFVHLFNHALMKGALFLALGCVVYRIGETGLKSMAGLGRHMPWTMGAFLIAGLSLVGVPLTAGFISKWNIVTAALERGWWPIAGLVVATSLLAAIYVGRVLEVAYLRPAAPGAVAREAPFALLGPVWVLALANLYFGIDTSVSVGVSQRAAEALLGAGP